MRAAIFLSTVLLGASASAALATDAATCEGLRNTVFSGGYVDRKSVV